MNKKVLIVEDDTFLKDLSSAKLTKEGFQVTSVGNAVEAAASLEKDAPDLILLDLVLPGTDGFGVLQKIRENPKFTKTPVIVFSNLSDDSDVEKATTLGASLYMIKSNFTLDELVSKIKTLLG